MLNDIEIWLPIPNFEGLYEISDYGRVKSLERTRSDGGVIRERILKYGGNHYPNVSLSKYGSVVTVEVHRIVAELFVSNPECKPQVNHKDLNKWNPAADNLEWTSHLENHIHAVRNNRHSKKLNEDVVAFVRRRLNQGSIPYHLAKQLKVTSGTIYAIQHRRIWRYA